MLVLQITGGKQGYQQPRANPPQNHPSTQPATSMQPAAAPNPMDLSGTPWVSV